jgi:phosphate transport system protein
MTKHFQRELEKIKKMILSLGAMVEDRVRLAILAINESNAEYAEKIIRSDYEIDEMEVEVEEECLKVMALHQPVAVDLRFLVVVIKINNDLERIGDEAVNIARRVKTIAKFGERESPFDYSEMAEKAELMLKMSLDALVNLDDDLAWQVVTLDDEVDDAQQEAYEQIKNEIFESSDQLKFWINVFLISRHLERLADHATNIAEEVIYLIEGEIVRHETP